MSRISNDIVRIRGEMASGHQARKVYVKDIKKDVAEMLAKFASLRPDRVAYTIKLRKETAERRQAVRAELAELRDAWWGTRAFRAAG